MHEAMIDHEGEDRVSTERMYWVGLYDDKKQLHKRGLEMRGTERRARRTAETSGRGNRRWELETESKDGAEPFK